MLGGNGAIFMANFGPPLRQCPSEELTGCSWVMKFFTRGGDINYSQQLKGFCLLVSHALSLWPWVISSYACAEDSRGFLQTCRAAFLSTFFPAHPSGFHLPRLSTPGNCQALPETPSLHYSLETLCLPHVSLAQGSLS